VYRATGAGDERARVPSGLFDQVLITKEFSPLEPRLLTHDFYALGVGPVLSLTVSGGADREELVSFQPARLPSVAWRTAGRARG
jgi:hypothetical protein